MSEIWVAATSAVVAAGAGAAANGLFNGGSQSQQSGSQSMPSWMTQQWQKATSQANNAAGRTSDQAIAPLNPYQQYAFANARNDVGGGMPQLAQAGTYQQGIATQGINPANIQNFQNPYTSQVVNTTLGQMDRQRAQQGAAINSQATAANAFGGDRAVVAQSLNNQNWDNAMGQTAASLNNQGFNTAAGLATQDAGLRLNAAGAYQGNTLAQQQLLAGQNANLLGAGNQIQQQSQNVANWPIQQSQIMASTLNAGVGGTTTSNGQYGNYNGLLQNALSGFNFGNNLYQQYQNPISPQQEQDAITGAQQYFYPNQ